MRLQLWALKVCSPLSCCSGMKHLYDHRTTHLANSSFLLHSGLSEEKKEKVLLFRTDLYWFQLVHIVLLSLLLLVLGVKLA